MFKKLHPTYYYSKIKQTFKSLNNYNHENIFNNKNIYK